ncbi:hypothetical protein VMCG_02507 [Cytospora schulzeri]|uniref:Uncharacterized protein n=1 Tax=Cytospora schulzeri TaxID=448051 RepID=A0A423X1S7_9PEZI|nr:hypothetical protein VMCG_02507 [Valsa malicola]
MGFRRTMRRLFGGRYKQMSNREVDELDRRITAEMRAGTFRAVQRGPQPPTADELWDERGAEDDHPGSSERLPTMSSSIIGGIGGGIGSGGGGGIGGNFINRPPTSVSQVSRGNRYYDEYGDDYGGYHDGYGYGYNGGSGGGGASSDSGYAAGYYERPTFHHPPPPPPMIPSLQQPPGRQSPAWYVPSGGPFDLAEAKPESVYDGGSRANSMRSNVTRGSRRPSTQQGGYYTPTRPFRENRSYSAQSDPGRLYARSPLPRMPYLPPQQPWDEQYYDGGGGGGAAAEGGSEYGRGGGGGGGGYGYRGWNGESIVEHEYPIDNRGYGEDYHYRGS